MLTDGQLFCDIFHDFTDTFEKWQNSILVLVLKENRNCSHSSMALPMKLLLNLERRRCLPVRASAESDAALPAHVSTLQTVPEFSLSSLHNLIPAFQNNNYNKTTGHQIDFLPKKLKYKHLK